MAPKKRQKVESHLVQVIANQNHLLEQMMRLWQYMIQFMQALFDAIQAGRRTVCL